MTDREMPSRTDSERPCVSKEPYHTPKLTVHGKIDEVTGNISLGSAEGMTGSKLI